MTAQPKHKLPEFISVNSEEFANHAMLVELSVQAWTGVATDAIVSEKVRDEHGADQLADVRDVGLYRKVLVERKALQEIKRIGNKIRNFHYDSTLPWKAKVRVLPVANYYEYRRVMDELVDKRSDAVNEFLAIYPQAVESAKRRLGEMFNDDDYPEPDALREKMGVNVDFDPVPKRGHFVVDGMVDQERTRVVGDYEARIEDRIVGTVQHLGERLVNAVEAVNERLDTDEDGEAKTFRNSLITNLVGIARSIPNLNLTDNEVLNEASEKILEALDNVTPDELRARHRMFNSEKTNKVRGDMRDVQEFMAGYFGTPSEDSKEDDNS